MAAVSQTHYGLIFCNDNIPNGRGNLRAIFTILHPLHPPIIINTFILSIHHYIIIQDKNKTPENMTHFPINANLLTISFSPFALTTQSLSLPSSYPHNGISILLGIVP